MPEKRFRDSRKRIERAIAHGKAVSKQWAELFDPSAQPKIVRRGPNNFAATVKIKREDDNDISLELGEYFYQLRAALDGVAFESMVLETAQDPPPRENSVEFPIYEKPDKFRNNPLIQTIPPEAAKWIESIQPYSYASNPDADLRELGRLLTLLHNCARKDRHRRLHFIVAGAVALKTAFECEPGVKISNVKAVPIDFLGDDADFLTFDTTFTDVTQSGIRLKTALTIEFGLREFPDCIGQGVMNELERLMLATKEIVDVFELAYPL